ncbi:hypothetical protein GOV09_06905 [Candidatus Woesearchaeota archaeon]|nr:hypothetical protein [Candidatus Woesearchaeota archaeon]
MELTKEEQQTIKFILERQLEQFKKEEVKRDVPINFLEAEKEYEKFLENLLKKF